MPRSLLAACLLIGAAAAAGAAPLRLVADQRSVASFGTATTVTERTFFDGTPPETTVVTDAKARAPLVYAATSRTRSFNAADGMSLRTPLASVDGQGAQTSSFSATGIRFSGVADVLANAANTSSGGDGFQEIGTGVAGGSALSAARWTFALDAVQPMQLSMTSNLSLADLGGFTFSLTSDNGFAWTTPYVDGDQGLLFTFTTGLKLRPGTYTLDARLSAGVSDVQDASRGDRATASFSLLAVSGIKAGAPGFATASAVPEPSAAALLMAGLLLSWGERRVRRSRRP